jgi:hypothetical protein
MKNSKLCPKCKSNEIIKVPGKVGAYGTGNNISTGLTIFSAVPVTRYLCGNCGFSEEWIDQPQDIEKIRKKSKAQPLHLAD